MAKITFTPGSWEDAGLVYGYSWRFPEKPVFLQEETCIINAEAPGTRQLFDYMGLFAPETYTTGAKISVRCSFEDWAAPMLTISQGNEIDEEGTLRTLDYFEIVLYKNGINVWRLQTENRTVRHYKVLGALFPVSEKEIHTLSAEIQKNRLIIQVDDRKFELFAYDLQESFLLGYTACEGYCRLYEMEIV